MGKHTWWRNYYNVGSISTTRTRFATQNHCIMRHMGVPMHMQLSCILTTNVRIVTHAPFLSNCVYIVVAISTVAHRVHLPRYTRFRHLRPYPLQHPLRRSHALYTCHSGYHSGCRRSTHFRHCACTRFGTRCSGCIEHVLQMGVFIEIRAGSQH